MEKQRTRIRFNKNYDALENKENPKKFSASHLAGLGVGGVIGAGYFLGCGLAIHESGPSVVIAYLLGGLIMLQVLGSMTSINVNRLTHGSFRVYTEQFCGPYLGFLLGWIVFISGIFTIASESIAMSVFIKFWFPNIPLPATSVFFTFLIVIINSLNMENFGRIEGTMAALKILALILFIVLGAYALIFNPLPTYPKNFTSIRAFFPNGISGFFQSMLIVIFSYSGISAIVMASSEVENAKTTIPKAVSYMSISIILVYILSMFTLISLIAWDKISTDQSPFVQAINSLKLSWAAYIINIIILLAAFSVMVASYYASIQMVTSLAEAKKAPSLFAKASKKGFYRNSWILVGAVSIVLVALSFLLSQKLFNYLVSASSYFTFINWITNLFTYLIWLKKRNKNEVYKSPLVLGRFGAYVTILAIAFMFIMSLGVPDFRMGFYSALIIITLITFSYIILNKTHLEND
ncbi:amino acid permease [Clostridium sp. PL3]|uniref:Amino acid permease n=1 Tax=Clostridium thailandense TaxID=2794346 RepID=A0A949TK94_9CLOT|nr:amino acid permease [Clostridium thailandense]MBV7274389.1 amino acid permease [Clostridium thailandense]